jgi:FAD dependent oxidoreductase
MSRRLRRTKSESGERAGFRSGRVTSGSRGVLLSGVRETRRLNGLHMLTGDEIRAGVTSSDSIAVGCWPIDVHPNTGQVGSHKMFVPRPYEIPYRALLPASTAGLIVAGRCISVDREALGSVRVGATCAATGHAAGAAAALAAERRIEPRDLDVVALQDALHRQEALVFARDVEAT